MTVLGALLRTAENPGRPLTDATLLDTLGGEPTAAGVHVDHETAYRMTAVYRGIALLAGLIGAMPLHAYRRTPGKGRERYPSPLIDSPHPDKTPFEVWEFAGQSLVSWGNSYQHKRRDRLGRVRELEPIHPSTVRVERRDAWISGAAPTGKRFFVRDGGVEREYTPHQLLHIPGLSYDGLVGMSPVGLARQNIGLGLAAEAFGARLFDKGALIQGVLQTEQTLAAESAGALKAQWRAKTAGGGNHWDIPVLDSGATYKPIALPPEDAQYMQTRRYSVVEVARLFGLPPHLLGDVERSTSWGTGIEQQNMQMLVFTADPWLVRVEQRVTREAVLDSTQYVRFNRAALLRADTAQRFMAYQRAVNNGWMNADEIRGLEDMDPLPDGTGATFYRPANVVPVGPTTTEDAQ